MIMMRLPLIVGKTAGLIELIKNDEPGICINIDKDNRNKSIISLPESIILLLENEIQSKLYAKNARYIF